MEKKTPLYDKHIALGGRMVEFGGYSLPVQYESGILKEHLATRNAAGIFDVSHMGEFILEGADSLTFLQYMLTNDFSAMKGGNIKYTIMCFENGGTVDDLLVYKLNEPDKYMLVVNASNREKDFEWLSSHIDGYNAKLTDISDQTALIALQGPKAAEILRELVPTESIPEKNYSFKDNISINGIISTVSRTGYTGEDGFEFYMKWNEVEQLFNLLLETGAKYGLIPCGLGARDTLRLEASMPLYGHELTAEISPVAAGLDFFIKTAKPDFMGREALIKEQQNPEKKRRIGIIGIEKGIIREHCDLYDNETKIGETTSGTFCPYINKTAAMAMVTDAKYKVGDVLCVDIRGRRIKAEIVDLPFYKRIK